MTTKHFKLTADASSTTAAGRDVSRAFMNIARAAKAVNHETAKFQLIPGHLRRITHEAHITRLALDRLANKAWWNAMKMKYAYEEVKHMFPDMKGGGGGGGGGGYDANDPRNRPLFGSAGNSLQQGQAVQNAIMAMLPALIPVVIAAAGKYFHIQEEISSVKLANALKRAGVGGSLGDFRNQANRLSDFTGNSQQEIEDLFGNLANSGVRDARQAAAFANLALSIEAAGGSATDFVKALKGEPEEIAEKLNAVAENLGITVPEFATVNDMLKLLSENLGDLSHEVNNAKEGFPELWNTIKENLAILGNEGTTGKVVEMATAALGGEPAKAAYMGTNMLQDAIDAIPWKLGMVAPGIATAKLTGIAINKPFQALGGGLLDRRTDSMLDSRLASGKINQEQYGAQVKQYYDMLKRGDYGGLWDNSMNPNDPSRVGPKAPVQLEPKRGSGKIDKKNHIQTPEEYPSTRVSFEVRGNPFQPSVFNGHAGLRLK